MLNYFSEATELWQLLQKLVLRQNLKFLLFVGPLPGEGAAMPETEALFKAGQTLKLLIANVPHSCKWESVSIVKGEPSSFVSKIAD